MVERGDVEPVGLVVELVDLALTCREPGVEAEFVDHALALRQLPHPDVEDRIAIQ